MRSCDKTYTITEYGGFTRDAALYGYQGLPKKPLMRSKHLYLPTTHVGRLRLSNCFHSPLGEA